MIAEELYLGGEHGSVEIISGAPPTFVGADYITPYSRCAILCRQEIDIIRFRAYDTAKNPTSIGVGDNAFFHYIRSHHGLFNAYFHPLCLIRDAAGFPWLGIFPQPANTPYLGLYLNDGAGNWSQLGSNQSYGQHTPTADDIRIAIDGSGNHTIEWSVAQNQSVLVTLGGATSRPSWTNVAMADLSAWEFGGGIYFSQMAITRNIPTIGCHVWANPYSGAGAHSDWSGTAADISESDLSDTSNLQTGNAGDKSTFTAGAVATPDGYVIAGAMLWTRGKSSGLSPANIDVLVRQSGVDHEYPLTTPGVSYSNLPLRLDADPNGDPWTDVTWNAAEKGVKAEP